MLYFVLPQSYIVGPVKNPNSNERGGIDFLLFFQIRGYEFLRKWEKGEYMCTTKRTLWVELLLESA